MNVAPSVIKNLDGSSARGMIASLLRKQRISAAKQRGMSLFSDRHTGGGLGFPRRRRCRRLIICGKNSKNSGNRCPADVLYCERFRLVARIAGGDLKPSGVGRGGSR